MRYLTVFRHEAFVAAWSPAAAAGLAIAFVLFVLAFHQGETRAQAAIATAYAAEAENWAGWVAQAPQNPHGAAHYPMLLAKPAAPLAGLAAGVDAMLGGHVFTDAHRVVPVNGAAAADLPLAAVVGALDAAFVVGVALPLLALLAGADAVAGEKERGTLRLVFANPVGRGRWLAAKLAARAAVLLGLVGVAAIAAWLVVGGVRLGEGAAWRLPLLVAASALYLLLWLLAGAACSACCRRAASATLAALAVWIGLVAVLPRGLAAAAVLASPPPASAPARMQTRIEEVRLRRRQAALVEAARARGELAGASATAQHEGRAPIREAIDAEAARARAEADAPLAAWRSDQLGRMAALGYLSPALLYMQLATAIAGTDAARHADFLAQAHAYRQAFLGELNGLEDAGQASYDGYRRMRRFAFAERGPAALLAAEAPRFGALAALAAAFLALALARFKRYDLR